MRETPQKPSSNPQPAEKQSPFVAPSISLPKGGGAIRGIGEKFAANPVTGTGSMSVPIATSPGRSGFGPQLSLSYDSGAGNGPFGFGWSLSLPSITRRTDKGLPQYLDGGKDQPDGDVFILSGAEDLVPVLTQNQLDNWVLKDLDSDDEQYLIRRYRPRVEGLFARIESWTRTKESNGTPSTSEDVHWRSISKDNILTIYGKDQESRIFDPGNPRRIFSWLICETRDDRGNAVVYEYKSEDGAGVDMTLPSERNRGERNSPERRVNRYLKTIRYGNRASFLDAEGHRPFFVPEVTLNNADWMFEVVFDYGEGHYTKESPDADGRQFVKPSLKVPDGTEWTLRQDCISSYRATFEVRTLRLCQRVLMFHHFPKELGIDDCLVRSTEFAYLESSVASFITSVTQSGYVRQPAGGELNRYLCRSLPPLEFEYSRVPDAIELAEQPIEQVETDSLENLPYGLSGGPYQWVDLDGEGISGILSEQGDAWYYKRNLSPLPLNAKADASRIKARFAPLEVAGVTPNASLNDGNAQFMDLAGDGLPDLVSFEGTAPGFYEHDQEFGWDPFHPFVYGTNLDTQDPKRRFTDLTGDGLADILITEGDCIIWYPSLGEAGFGPAKRVFLPIDEELGPRLVFADGTESIFLADLSGDGMSDLVRIRNSEICYWPNLGYGRFGCKVTMNLGAHFGSFDTPDQFDPKRIRLADIDGSGPTDILYLHREGVHIYFNQSGNGWSDRVLLPQFPRFDNTAGVQVLDLLGNGTACLVWSSSLPQNSHHSIRYIDLMNRQKPHLLVGVKNNLGAETKIDYASSTKFYLSDKYDGRPWITKLPFPVQVVERAQTYDHISRNLFVKRYAYHHGYFDGSEREFRGFGMVEAWDTEQFEIIGKTDLIEATNLGAASHVPPVLTKTWFHTGAYLDGDRISTFFAQSTPEKGGYYRESDQPPGAALTSLLDDTVLDAALTTIEQSEACRALKGAMLRQEVYSLDGTPKQPLPYTVSERNYEVRRVQPAGPNLHAVFFTHPRETIDLHYERDPEDPRVSQSMTLKVDEYGNVERAVAIGYPRRAVTGRTPEQEQAHITLTVNRFLNHLERDVPISNAPDWHRIGVPIETQTFEVVELVKPNSLELFNLDSVRHDTEELFPLDQLTPDPGRTIPYEQWDRRHTAPQPTSPRLRLIEHVRNLYRRDDLVGALSLGEVQSRALPYDNYKLAFTAPLLSQNYVRDNQALLDDSSSILKEGGYLEGDSFRGQGLFPPTDSLGLWWFPTGQIFYSLGENDPAAKELDFALEHFFLPHRYRDPFGASTLVQYDEHSLLLVETQDAVGNVVSVPLVGSAREQVRAMDYRVLQPWLVRDPNNNRTQITFDSLGLVVGTAVMGKEGENLGDLIDESFQVELTRAQMNAFFADPLGQAEGLLGNATSRVIYDLECYNRAPSDRKPVFAATLARETHFHDELPPQGLKIQVNFSFSDGFEREIQKKIQAEPGPIEDNGAIVSPRWVGSGWTIFNNKGKPVKQYEPFFDDTHDFRFGKKVGVSTTLFYDPLERVVVTLHANETYEKVVFDPWLQKTFDVNDTVTFDPIKDPEASAFFTRLSSEEYSPTWYEQRVNDHTRPEEKRAAERAAEHADTPTLTHFDALGRAYLTVAHNKFRRDSSTIEESYSTLTVLDIENNQRAVIDARGRIVMSYEYDTLGNRIKQVSMDAGTRWMLNDVTGKPVRAWDSRGHTFITHYDALRRPTRSFVVGTAAASSAEPVLFEKIIYGESEETGLIKEERAKHNLRGKTYQLFDQAGVVTNESYDFKGNLTRTNRQLVQDYRKVVDWSLKAAREKEIFTSSTRYDALNRVIQAVAPHSGLPGARLDVIQPIYNAANLLNNLDVWQQQLDEPSMLLDPTSATLHAVTNIDYNAKGQRVKIEYGSGMTAAHQGVTTTYDYDDDTFRLIHLVTTRPDTFAADKRTLQDLSYTYDPVGNITHISDQSQPLVFFDNACIDASNDYLYDSVYRLIAAKGREHKGQDGQPDWDDSPRMGSGFPNNCQELRNYVEIYRYDEVGNILRMIHHEGADLNSPGVVFWNRRYQYRPENNRLCCTSLPGDADQPDYATDPLAHYSVRYDHDAHGNITRMPHLSPDSGPNMHWNFKDQLHQVEKGGGGTAYYVYDAAGQRVRKVWEKAPGLTVERIYLGGWEIFRERNGSGQVTLERETLHIMDEKQRVALVETRTKGSDGAALLIRYELGNHLGSAAIELAADANITSYEEYYPYGNTSYQAARSGLDRNPKRYRYTGKERDEESGLNYHAARYLAPWLGRWISCDPAGVIDGMNLYAFARLNPIGLIDPDGLWSWPCLPSVARTAGTDNSQGQEQIVKEEAPKETGKQQDSTEWKNWIDIARTTRSLLSQSSRIFREGEKAFTKIHRQTDRLAEVAKNNESWLRREADINRKLGSASPFGRLLGGSNYLLQFGLNYSRGLSMDEAIAGAIGGGMVGNAMGTYLFANKPQIGWVDTMINLTNVALNFSGVPKEITDLTTMLASVTPSSFGTALGSNLMRGIWNSVKATQSGDTSALKAQLNDVVSGREGGPLQGWGFAYQLTSSDPQNGLEAATDNMTNFQAERGDQGPAVALGNMIADEWYEYRPRELLSNIKGLAVTLKWSFQKWLGH